MFSFTHIWAQNGVKDSLYKELPKPVLDEVYQLKFKEVLVPVMGIGTAALFVCDGWFTEQRENVQDLLSAKGRNKIKFDDYMQYSPMVAVYGLNLAGVKGKHSFKGRTIILAMSYATMGMIVNTMKYSFKEKRPDSNTRNSFPSGHTATAFMGAEFLYRGGSKLNCVIVLFFLLASKISFHIEFIFRYLSESKIMVYLID